MPHSMRSASYWPRLPAARGTRAGAAGAICGPMQHRLRIGRLPANRPRRASNNCWAQRAGQCSVALHCQQTAQRGRGNINNRCLCAASYQASWLSHNIELMLPPCPPNHPKKLFNLPVISTRGFNTGIEKPRTETEVCSNAWF